MKAIESPVGAALGRDRNAPSAGIGKYAAIAAKGRSYNNGSGGG